MMIPVILGISFIIFAIMSFTPGDPARMILGQDATFEQIAELRSELGLDQPFLVRYAKYVADALRLDFGNSYVNNVPVIEEIAARFPSTMWLAAGATFLMVMVGVPIGIISAVKQYSLIDNVSLVSALLLTSMPAFWLGPMMTLLFALTLNWLPAIGVDTPRHYILPCVTRAAAMMASLIRMTRSNMLEVIRQDYIRTARAKGANERIVIYKHALRNALLPVITIIGLNFGGLMGGTMIIESCFAMPGMGTRTIGAIREKDLPVVMANILFVAILSGVINLVIDIIYAYVDPRVKSQYAKPKA
jgi:peptide/nickel transport system permease protein